MHAIELVDVCKAYQLGTTQVPVLRGVNLAVAKHDSVALIGESGSGKSTLLNLIGFLDRPDSGEIRVFGERVADYSDAGLSRFRNRTVGFVFQSFHLLPNLTALDNVLLPLRYRGEHGRRAREAGEAALAEVGIAHRSGHRPNEMSGGERQRVAIARSLVGDPDIVLADEPTGNLDSRNTREILELFTRIRERGRTLVVVTHAEAVADYCQRVVRIEDGRVKEAVEP